MVFLAMKKSGGKKRTVACVGLVLSLWKCSKKPKLSPDGMSMKHCVAARVVHLDIGHESAGLFGHASSTSTATIVRPMSIVCILDVENCKEDEEGVSVKLSPSCKQIVDVLAEIPDWFPEPDPEAEFSFSILGGAPEAKKRKRGRKPRKPTGLTEKTAKKKKRAKKKNQTGTHTLKKKSGEKQKMACAPENFRRNAAGRSLIRDTLKEILLDDLKANKKNPIFSLGDDMCRLKVPECQGVTFDEVVDSCPDFFITKPLVFLNCHRRRNMSHEIA